MSGLTVQVTQVTLCLIYQIKFSYGGDVSRLFTLINITCRSGWVNATVCTVLLVKQAHWIFLFVWFASPHS